MRKTLAGLAFAFTLASAQSPTVEVKGVGNFIHIVSNLDKSLEFYRDILGMEQPRPAAPIDTPEILKMYNAVGAKLRVGNTRIAGSPMQMELEEYTGIDRKPIRVNSAEPGASLLILTVRQLEPILAKLKAAGIKPLSEDGGPKQIGPDLKGVTVSDPDGFFVILEAKDGTPTAAPGETNIIGLRWAFVVGRLAPVKRQFEALGLKPVEGMFELKDPYHQLLNATRAVARLAIPLPNVSWPLEFIEMRSSSSVVKEAELPYPGAPVLRLAVNDATAAVDALKRTGAKVASVGGEVLTLPGGKAQLRAAILSLPNYLFVQVLQQ